jgi:hypothetical protein
MRGSRQRNDSGQVPVCASKQLLGHDESPAVGEILESHELQFLDVPLSNSAVAGSTKIGVHSALWNATFRSAEYRE